tara:strand:- start:298 stop:477 length:180 start_codon:yes stop_codon:yes gene_type:complete
MKIFEINPLNSTHPIINKQIKETIKINTLKKANASKISKNDPVNILFEISGIIYFQNFF